MRCPCRGPESPLLSTRSAGFRDPRLLPIRYAVHAGAANVLADPQARLRRSGEWSDDDYDVLADGVVAPTVPS